MLLSIRMSFPTVAYTLFMIRGFGLALAQMGDPTFRRAAFGCLALTVLVFVIVSIPIVWGASVLGKAGFEQAGGRGEGWEWVVSALSGALGLVVWGLLAAVLFVTISTAIYALFLDGVVEAVYARHFPGVSPGTELSLGRSIRVAIRFLVATLLLNLLALPLYLLGLFFPLFDLALYAFLNGCLLGREFFELVGLRHLPVGEVDRLRRANRTVLWIWGALTSLLFLVPIVNLFAPLVATAAMVHLYCDLEGTSMTS